MSDSNRPNNPREALMVARLIWVALLGGQIILAVAVVVLNWTGHQLEHAAVGGILAGISGLMLIGGVPAGLFIRGQILKRHWVGGAVQPGGYLTGNLILWAMIEGASIVGLIAALIAGSLWPYGVPAAAAIGLLAVLRPDGRAMQPSPNPDATESSDS